MSTKQGYEVRDEVWNEVQRAMDCYAPFASAHEGYAVILEEVRELEAEVFKSPRRRSYQKMYTEARHVAAMAIRFMLDVDDKLCTSESVEDA